MFKILFALFAIFAAAFAAPEPAAKPSPLTGQVVSYGAPLAYSGYHVPVAAYSHYSHLAAVPTAYSYSTPFFYH